MISYRELREDLLYLSLVEFAIFVAISANAIYSSCYICVFNYFLVLLWVMALQIIMLRDFRIKHEKNFKLKFELLDKEKKRAKILLVLSISLSILFSSWGIISFITLYYGLRYEYIQSLLIAMPFYSIMYLTWLVYLGYIKNKYVKFVISLLKKNQ